MRPPRSCVATPSSSVATRKPSFISTSGGRWRRTANHPRAHYLLGLDHSEHERLKDAAAAYERAIECYPATDKYHLNETWNNLGNVYYRDNRIQEAKGAWEKALTYAPRDTVTRTNLREFIYDNDALSDELRKPSPFVARLLP